MHDLDLFISQLRKHCPMLDVVKTPQGEVMATVAGESLKDACLRLRDIDDLSFEMLMDLCGVDYASYGQDGWREEESAGGYSRAQHEIEVTLPPFAPSRFAVVYHLLSIKHNRRLRLKTWVKDAECLMVPSVTSIWSCANWYEREAYDLFGIFFDEHPDLRRILTDYGFVGHPLRKDFPLVGHVEMHYDAEQKRCVYAPVSIDGRVNVPRVIRKDPRYIIDQGESKHE